MRHRRFVVVLGLLLSLVPCARSHAGGWIRITIEGAKQGVFKPDDPAHPHDGITVVQYAHEVTASHDLATGQASGKRQHQPVKLVKLVGPSSPQFYEAIASNEVLKSVTIEFLRSNAAGKFEAYYSVKLTNATIVSLDQFTDQHDLFESISLTYQKIEMEHKTSKTMAIDDWRAR